MVAFMKDNMDCHQPGFQPNSFDTIMRIASSSNGFACVTMPYNYSAYHDKEALFQFDINRFRYKEDGVQFNATNLNTTGKFYEALDAGPSPAIVQVCHGGIFVASASNIFKSDIRITNRWKQY